MFIGIGLLFAIGSLQYDRGTLLQMGPGYFPLAVSLLLIAIGIASVVKAFISPDKVHIVAPQQGEDGPIAEVEEQRVAQFGAIKARPTLAVLGSVALFAFTVNGLGLIPALFICAMVASQARPGSSWLRILIVSACLAVGASFLFVQGLGLRAPYFGPWLGG